MTNAHAAEGVVHGRRGGGRYSDTVPWLAGAPGARGGAAGGPRESPLRARPIALQRGAITNERGEFEIGELPPGRHLLVVRRLGFAPWQDSVTLADGAAMPHTVGRIPGVRQVYDGPASYLAASRAASGAGPAFQQAARGSACWVAVYIDGVLVYDGARMGPGAKPPDFSRLETDSFAGVEFYAGGASVPPQYNATSAGCGTLLLWTRER